MDQKGIMTGYPNGNFGPSDSVNRAQLATVINRYDEKMILPAIDQLMRLHRKGRRELEGSSWQQYMEKAEYFDVKFSSGGEGEPGVDPNFDMYSGNAPEGWHIACNATTKLGGTPFGWRIIAFGDWEKAEKTPFFIWYNAEIGITGSYGFFYDDVKRLVNEAKTTLENC